MPPTSPNPQRAGVFISYARSDGEPIATSLRARLEDAGIPLWRDREGMEGGKDWWLQITSALDTVEFMLLVMTPAAAASALVRREWRYARQRGVCVYPIKATADFDFAALPRWMSLVHFYDLDQEWPKLLRDLRAPCERRRVPFMAEDLPPEFIARSAELDQLLVELLGATRDDPVAATVGIRAAGGYGKTMLARAVCHHPDVQNAFDDGVLWVSLGESPGELTGRIEDLIYVLSGQRPGFNALEPAVSMFVELIADRAILLVIDDVWEAAHLKPFLQGGARSARVLTTRVLDTIPANAKRLDLGPMQPGEAVALLGYSLSGDAKDDLQKLAGRLCEWPLLLTMANASLRDRVQAGQSASAAIAYVNRALDKRGLGFFDARDAVARTHAVRKALELSVERLTADERQRFAELAVFPEDIAIPMRTLETLWKHTGGIDEFDTENLCDRLNRLSLTLTFDPTRRFIRMHDIIRRLLMDQIGAGYPALHRQLLDAHRPPSGRWADLPLDDPYLWDHMASHLSAAGSVAELTTTVSDLRYLAAKSIARSASAAERDLLLAETESPGDPLLARLRRSFAQASHIVKQGGTTSAIESTLHSRFRHTPELKALVVNLEASLRRPYLTARQPLPDLPHPALIRTFSGHSSMWGCAVAPDGTFVVAAASDGSVIVWDTTTFSERMRLLGHAGWVRRCAVSADGKLIVSASYDRRLHIWNAATGALIRVLAGHTDGVTDCAISPDGSFIVSTSHDETVRVWDLANGDLRHTMAAEWYDKSGWMTRRTPTGHTATVWGCAISPDGQLIASASSDETLRIWDARTGQERTVLSGHTATVTGCAFSPDGAVVASAAADRTVRIWNTLDGSERLVLLGHTGAVNRCAFTPDGSSLVSVSSDLTARVWDVRTGKQRQAYYGHTDWVNDCAVTPDSKYAVSASRDHTLKIWDLSEQSTGGRREHRDWVNRIAVNATAIRAASASDDMTVNIWDAETGAVTETLEGHDGAVRDCAFGLSDAYFITASSDKTLKIWSINSRNVTHTLTGHRDWVNACRLSPDGELLLSASSDKTLRVWDMRSLVERLRILGHDDAVNACAFAPDGTFFVSASSDGTLKVWTTTKAREVWEALAVQQRKFSAAQWEEALCPLVMGHTNAINDCDVSPDSMVIVSASHDRTLKLWNARVGTLRTTLRGHTDSVYGCSFSPRGTLLASAADDGTIRIWDLSTTSCRTTLHVDGGLRSCAWLDGNRLIACGAGGVYYLEFVGGAG